MLKHSIQELIDKRPDLEIDLDQPYTGLYCHVNFTCSCGRKSNAMFRTLLEGSLCRSCMRKDIDLGTSSLKYTLDDIKKARPDITILTEEYKNIKEPLEYICICGRKHKSRGEKLLKGALCPSCASRKKWEQSDNKITLDSLQKKYKNLKIESFDGLYAEVLCNNCQKTFKTRYSTLNNRRVCQKCARKKRGFKYTTGYLNDILTDIEILEPYKGIQENVKWQCKKCHDIRYSTPDNLMRGLRACKCVPKSKPEEEVADYIKSLGVTVLRNRKTIIDGYELDIYIPDKKVAIEYNGNFWHSSLNKKKDYHYNKYKACSENGIRLIQVWEYEWNDPRKKDILKSIIRDALGLSFNVVDVESCKFEIKKSRDVQKFFDLNNLAGSRNGYKAFCLTYQGEIVQCMLLGKSTFYKNGYKDTGKAPFEIIRAATKRDTQVRGGTSRLLKHIEEYVQDNPLLYFVELDHFNGSGLRNRANWKLERVRPSIKVWWRKQDIVKNRDSYNHKYFKEQEALGNALLIYTAGTAKYVYMNNKTLVD